MSMTRFHTFVCVQFVCGIALVTSSAFGAEDDGDAELSMARGQAMKTYKDKVAPFINTWLVQVTGDKAAPVYYILFAAAVGLVGLSVYRGRPSVPGIATQPAQ